MLEDAIILEAKVVSTTTELGVRRLLNFRAGARARAGGLEHVTMQFELTDGRTTGGTFLEKVLKQTFVDDALVLNDFVPPQRLEPTEFA